MEAASSSETHVLIYQYHGAISQKTVVYFKELKTEGILFEPLIPS